MTTVERSRSPRTEPAVIMPGGRQITASGADTGADDALFRFPAADDPAPATGRLLGMSLYAATLGLTGFGIGTRGLLTAIGGTPFWFLPSLALLGLLSVVAAVGAFLSIHRPRLPWLLLLSASVPTVGAALLAALY